MSKKIRIGIEVDEILRAKWLQFDRFYAQEFGEEGIPTEKPLSYTFDYFNTYRWEDTVEKVQELKEPEDMPDNISPVHYQVDEKTGEADADSFLFKKAEEVKLTAREVYNRFMYEDYCFEIHASATMMYKGMDLDIKNFLLKYDKSANFTVMSIENHFSIPPTLFFLSKITSRFKEYRFVDEAHQMWDNVDVLITSNPELLKMGTPWGRTLIKVKRPYNENIKAGSLEILQINDLIDNKEFEKIIKYKK
jgi:hypothetical protein